MPQNETNIWKSIQLCLSPLGCRLFRNQRYKGPIVAKGKITSAWADCGVGGDGGHDLIGWRSFIITPDMVGKRIAQFFSIETKTRTGSAEKEQKTFRDGVKNAGGLSGIARSDDDAKKIMDDW